MTPQAVASPPREPTAVTPRRRAIVVIPALAAAAPGCAPEPAGAPG